MTLRRRIALLLVLAAVGLGVYFFGFVRPWLASPDPAAVAEAWKVVEKRVADSPARPAGDPKFDAFMFHAHAARQELRDLGKETPPGSYEALSKETRAALDALTAWSDEAKIDTAPPECVQRNETEFDVLSVAQLSEIALSTPPVGPRVTALTKLSERLRRSGGILHYAVGMKILDRLLERAALNPHGLPPFLKDTNANGREMLDAYARDVACVDRYFDVQDAIGYAGEKDIPFVARPFTRRDRERAMYRLFVGERVRAAEPFADEPTKLVQALDAKPQKLPASSAVRMTYANGAFSSELVVIKRYEELKKR